MWTIATPDTTYTYSSHELSDFLIKKILSAETTLDRQTVLKAFTDMIEPQLPDTTPRALIQTGFLFGFYYKSFLEKNNVVFRESVETPTQESTSQTSVSTN